MDPVRRKFLGVAAIAPVTAGELFRKAANKLPANDLGELRTDAPGYSPDIAAPARFTDFAKWAFKQEKHWRKNAKDICCLDPDIASLHVPLATAYRMQAERNYQEIIERNKDRFFNAIKKHSFFEWYE